MGDIEKFQQERQALNELVMKYAGLGTKRYYSLDAQAYREGVLPVKTKELLGLVASFVLRCDDCIKYHVIRCHEEGVSSEELEEALFIGLIVGGTITIPHQRRAMKAWDELKNRSAAMMDRQRSLPSGLIGEPTTRSGVQAGVIVFFYIN
jgi:AhpD family alkylhydroperoxidase